MKRVEIRDFLKAGVDLLTPSHEFGRGRLSEFNSKRNWKYPVVWWKTAGLESNQLSTGAPTDRWDIQLYIGLLDKDGSAADQYEALRDTCDETAQRLNYAYRQVVSGYKLVTIESFKRDPFTKINSDCVTGVILSFTLIAPDKTNVC